MSNYPPGVTGNEPQITGEWPCLSCGGDGGSDDSERDAWGYAISGPSCPRCRGSRVEPEEFDVGYLEDLAENGPAHLYAETVASVRYFVLDRTKPEERRILRAAAKMKREIPA